MAQNLPVPDTDGADALEPIAIIGMACRFPGSAPTPESFWELLSNARKGHGEVPKDRFSAEAWRHPSHERKGSVRQTPLGLWLRVLLAWERLTDCVESPDPTQQRLLP